MFAGERFLGWLGTMFDFEFCDWFEAGEKGEDVVEYLLGGHAEFSVARGDFEPAGFVSVITLGECFAVDENEVGVVSQIHV
jgi:hypothetical protein